MNLDFRVEQLILVVIQLALKSVSILGMLTVDALAMDRNLNEFYRTAGSQSATNTPIRIGQFTDSFPPIINGVSALVSEHHQLLLAQGYLAYVFTFGYGNYFGPGVVRSPGLSYGREFRANLFLTPYATRIAQSMDVFHIHEPFGIGRIALQIAKQVKQPIVFTNHTQHDVYVKNFPLFIQRPLQRYVARVMRTYLRVSRFSTTPSEYTARWMRQLAPEVAERVQVVHNGIDLTAFDHVEASVSRQRLNISPSSTVFITVGRVTPEKNLPVFAEAFLQAVQSGCDADWIVIGEGPVRVTLEKQLGAIAGRVHFLGAISHPLIPAYLAIADIFATPSLSETNSLSVIEAMASGKPFIGLQADWWDEFSDHQRMGILTEHSIPSHLDAIRRFCQDSTMRHTMGDQARLGSQQFDIRNVTTHWLELYQRAIKERLRD